jgi:hypothetical protein
MKKTVQWFLGTAAFAGLLVSCGNTKALDRDGVNALKIVGPIGLSSSTDFLRGSPIKLQSSIGNVQRLAALNPLAKGLVVPQMKLNSAIWEPRLETTNFAAPGSDTIVCDPNDPSDSDGDGIVKDVSCTIDAADEDDSSIRYVGQLVIKDADDKIASSGYFIDFNVKVDFSATLSGKLRVTSDVKAPIKNSDPYLVKQSLELEVSTDEGVVGVKYVSDMKYNPSTTAGPGAGEISLDSKLDFYVNSDRYALGIKADLRVDTNICTEGIIDGQATYTSGRDTLIWNKNGCGSSGLWDDDGLSFNP